MPTVNVDGQIFDFSDEWEVTQIDQWPTYKNHLIPGHKACDVVAISAQEIVMIEVKDYTYPQPEIPAPQELALTIAHKVLGSSAMLFAFSGGKHQRGSQKEREFSARTRKKGLKFRVVASVEVPDRRAHMSAHQYLSTLKNYLKKYLKHLCDDVIVDSVAFPSSSVEWTHRRDPDTRLLHKTQG